MFILSLTFGDRVSCSHLLVAEVLSGDLPAPPLLSVGNTGIHYHAWLMQDPGLCAFQPRSLPTEHSPVLTASFI